MRFFAPVSIAILICMLACPSAGLANNSTQTVLADSIMDGNAGTILRFEEIGFPAEDAFVIVEAGKYRVYALREVGSPWAVLTPARYFVPVASMTIGQTWRFVDTELGEETLAEVVALEQVTVTAGTFTCYRIDVTTASLPFVIESIWLADGVGPVKEVSWSGDGYNNEQLASYSVTGTGFFPLDVGNVWNNTDVFTPTAKKTWGALKSLYR